MYIHMLCLLPILAEAAPTWFHHGFPLNDGAFKSVLDTGTQGIHDGIRTPIASMDATANRENERSQATLCPFARIRYSFK